MMEHNEPGVWSTSVPSRSPQLIIVSIIFVSITTFFFAFRQVWRFLHKQRGLDDGMAAIAYAILVIQTVFGGIACHYGFGKHVQVIRPTASKAMEYFYLYQICYKLLGGFTKLTFCCLYLRLFSQRAFRILVMVVATIVALGSLAFALGTVLQCSPIRRAWDRTIPGHCISNTRFWYSHAAFNTFFDIVIYVMPMPIIKNLKLARGQRNGLISIFALGAFVIAASIVRMVMLRSSAAAADPTWGSMIALIWTEIEANTSVICCCLPALRVPFIYAWHKVRKSSTSTADDQEPKNEGAWLGQGQKNPTIGSGQPAKHSRKTTENSHSTGTKSTDMWFDRFLSIGKDTKHDASRNSSEIELSQSDDHITPTPQIGYIRQTTTISLRSEDLETYRANQPSSSSPTMLERGGT